MGPDELKLDPETLAELEQTAEDVLAGREPTVPWDEVRDRVLARFPR